MKLLFVIVYRPVLVLCGEILLLEEYGVYYCATFPKDILWIHFLLVDYMTLQFICMGPSW